MEFINRMRKDKKGFTLVEIIVVLVILAILAAFTIPAMLGFVNDARGKAYIAEAREVYVAAQATATEMNATMSMTDTNLKVGLSSPAVKVAQDKDFTTFPSTITTDDGKAAYNLQNKVAYQMQKYLKGDIVASDVDVATATTTTMTGITAGEAGWAVDVTDGKVTKVTYVKAGYKVTISGGNASVVKL
ncbi:prepilin-type N-terminal cleavage/methylation domain-containing protein [Acetobacterium fimetarium]|uniref:Prepilin-type N-terminal cleavage/methylation domain-containing protein n=1 Tax=Acetobacterium fimetarium TaxID=52691 RepID=A0ABR6WUY9_9FIRM|nr:type II secretion system protein [Acetobacterium fimetarium]MBC3804439.1 prepilin-type N-terminal cleavage/methylation domain-containing protein [Acetobacterium fimetarium]